MSSPSPASDDVPQSQPDTRAAVLARIHDVVGRLNLSYLQVVQAERAYEREKAARIGHYLTQGQSPSSAERIVRGDEDLSRLNQRLIETRGEHRRLETIYAHWVWLHDHLPPDVDG